MKNKIEVVFTGKIPSKKNSKRIVTNGNRPFIISSKAYKAWEKEWILKLSSEGEIETPCKLTVKFYPPTLHRFDLSNKLESIQDLFVEAGIIEDDCFKFLPEIECVFVKKDKDNPRIIATLETI